MTTELFMQWVDESSRLLTTSRDILLNRDSSPADIEGARAMIELARELRMVAKDIEAAKQARIAADVAPAHQPGTVNGRIPRTPPAWPTFKPRKPRGPNKPKSPTSSKGAVKDIPPEELFGRKKKPDPFGEMP